jgi:succinate dehydrogenase (ubiquinone) iron-sulfur subunit
MQALMRRSGQLLASELSLLSRASASAAASTSASSTGKPALNKEFLVYRWDPEEGGPPTYQSYKVDLNS